METKYIFGGYILTGGTLENGKPWKGLNVMLAEVKPSKNGGYDLPMVSFVAKASRSGSDMDKALLDTVASLPPGTMCRAYFSAPDSKGKSKLVLLTPEQ